MDIGCDTLLVGPGAAAAAIANGDITLSDLDTAVAHLLRVRFRLGEFDAADLQPYMAIKTDVVCSDAHQALARDSARQGLVLLANPLKLLPLSRSATRSIAVIGPGSNSSKIINGGPNYAGVPCGGAATTVVGAFEAAGIDTRYALGCDVSCKETSGFAAATAASAAADATVVVVAIDETIEDEGLDRVNITLPGHQAALVTATCGAARGPCIVVIMAGSSIDLTPQATSAATGGIFYAGFLGGNGAAALVDTILGDSAPAGRLSQTFYRSSFVDDVSMFEMGMRPGPSQYAPYTNPGRTHAYYTGSPLYPFGAGESYTTWSLTLDGPPALRLSGVRAYLEGRNHGGAYAPLDSETLGSYRVNVTNTGTVDSDYVVLGFLVPPGAGTNGIPLQTLFGFDRVRVAVGQTVSVWLGVGARDLTRVVHPEGGALVRVPMEGAWGMRIGPQGEQSSASPTASFVVA